MMIAEAQQHKLINIRADETNTSMRTFELNRDITVQECPWLPRDLKKGDVIYEYAEPTYGCISNSGVACTLNGQRPFFEVPRSALNRL